jgi:hypothetical protein
VTETESKLGPPGRQEVVGWPPPKPDLDWGIREEPFESPIFTSSALRAPAAWRRQFKLSGILRDDRAEIVEAFGKADGAVQSWRERDGWLALEILAPEGCEGAD